MTHHQEIRVNQYKTASSMFIYSCIGWSCVVVFVYSELSLGSIQPLLLEPAVPTVRYGECTILREDCPNFRYVGL